METKLTREAKDFLDIVLPGPEFSWLDLGGFVGTDDGAAKHIVRTVDVNRLASQYDADELCHVTYDEFCGFCWPVVNGFDKLAEQCRDIAALRDEGVDKDTRAELVAYILD